MSVRFALLCLSSTAFTAGLTGAAWAAPPAAGRADQVAEIRLEPGPLNLSLFALAKQTGVQIVFTSQMVAGRQAPAVSGRLTADQALERLIAGSDLQVQRAADRVLVLRPRGGLFPAAAVRGAQDPGVPEPTGADLPVTPPQALAEDPTLLSEIVVGSHIRGVKDGASPVIVLSREELDRDGRASVADALAALPQNFGGEASEDTASTGADPLATNSSSASGVNLRGLGADATLVLVNGRRLAGTGLKGDFADVSSIPMSAVDRVEILLDGASALYGSDAVGGVVNIVLKTRYDGAETRLLSGGATQGGATQVVFGQTVGKTWDSGHALVSYEHSARDRLRAIDRPYAGQADLRPYGGADHRWSYGSPGNLLKPDASGALIPAYAIPAGQDGTALTPSSFLPGVVNLENQQAGYDLLPRQRRDSLYLAFGQDLAPAIAVSGDARLGRRKFHSLGPPANTTIYVDANNPGYATPDGSAMETIAYSFQNELGGSITDGTAKSVGLSLGGQARLPKGWRLEAYGAFGQERFEVLTSNLPHYARLDEAVGVVPNDPGTAYDPAVDGYFNPFIGQGKNAQKVLDFVSAGQIWRKSRSWTRSVNFKLDGTLLTLPGGPVGVAIGGQARKEALHSRGSTFQYTLASSAVSPRDAERTVTAAFAEIRAPLFSSANARPGLRRLELSAAVRREDYGGAVHSTDPKIGIIWSPAAGATLKASYGTSFRAPALTELTDPQIIAPTILPNGPAQVISMLLYGGNADLKPETATSKALTLELAPPSWRRLQASATLFETAFDNRIGRPASENIFTVLSGPEFSPFRAFVSPASDPADLARIQALIDAPNSYAKGVFPATSYGAIVDTRYSNTGQLRVRGLDAGVRYQASLGDDPLALSLSGSWLLDYQRKVTPAASAVELAGTAGNPADLRLRASASWTHGAFTTTSSLNRVGDLDGDGGRRIHAWTTLDLNILCAPKASAWRGLTASLNVQNLLDRDPPFYDSALGLGYDPANADPVGRVVTLQLSKTW
ncbi:TonB-dependent receptor [Caulobacter sp. UNC358MFTsu5.1]|uniref:TonB-dependent receptor n=1 Tax=Caulobacter sp. UNC358MFTsu5.1 TaxID=1449049 RepID=UPI0004A743DE|nr:TonB-dependent receptor [Caulobacter sp. UNC358MFTsu5.1]